jgi:hypothetical protein
MEGRRFRAYGYCVRALVLLNAIAGSGAGCGRDRGVVARHQMRPPPERQVFGEELKLSVLDRWRDGDELAFDVTPPARRHYW